MRTSSNADLHSLRRRVLFLLLILTVAFAVRGLTFRFMRDHLTDPGWFQSGSYSLYDRRAQDILDGKAPAFWIDDPAQTEAAVYPPGYPLWLASIYKFSGNRSAYSVQSVQWLLDSIAVLLVVGIGVTAYGWPTGVIAGFLASLSPLLALNGATPSADSPSMWFVLAGIWMLLVAVKTQSARWAAGAGTMIGLSCWIRPNGMFLVLFLVFSVFLATNLTKPARIRLVLGCVVPVLFLIAPIVIRNAVVFRAFVPLGLGTGTNLWEGIGETERAEEFGAVYGDDRLVETERRELGIAEDARFTLYYPHGVQRDRERARKALSVIADHPLWYSRVMIRRMAGMLKYAGKPPRYMGSSGINVTSMKTLPPHQWNGPLALFVNGLGMLQSVIRWTLLPLIVVGLWLALRRHGRITAILLATVIYYLLVLSFLHTEMRYGLPMHALMNVWAAMALVGLAQLVSRLKVWQLITKPRRDLKK